MKIRMAIKIDREFMNQKIEALGLLSRSETALKKFGINTCRDLAKQWERLELVPRLGEKSRKEVRNKFRDWYMEQLTTEELKDFVKGFIKLEAKDM